MRRELFALASLLSLLLCATPVVLWLNRDLAAGDAVPGDGWNLYDGECLYQSELPPGTSSEMDKSNAFIIYEKTSAQGPPTNLRLRLGFYYWPTAAVFAVMPALWIAASLRRSKKDPALCATCQYNLTGNMSGVCPVCGNAVAAKE